MPKDHCPLCGDLNPLDVAYCRRCQYRLPWADAVEGKATRPPQKSKAEQAIQNRLKQEGLLPDRLVVCRYCEQPIEIEAKQCPHCGRWLVHRNHEVELDPWQTDFDEKATSRVQIIRPRAGCFAIVPLLVFALVWMLK